MKLIISGSRTLQASQEEIFHLITHYKLHPTEIVSGTAGGIDRCGEDFARKAYLKLTQFPADWDGLGKRAGMVRNQQMADYADALLLIWDGESRGSAGMKAMMEKAGKPVYEAVVKPSIQEKREYVKSQGQTRKHHCHWPNCTKDVPPAMWGCKEHWFKLPKRLRDRIWATYRPGQEVTMTPSKAYLIVANEVQEWIKENAK